MDWHVRVSALGCANVTIAAELDYDARLENGAPATFLTRRTALAAMISASPVTCVETGDDVTTVNNSCVAVARYLATILVETMAPFSEVNLQVFCVVATFGYGRETGSEMTVCAVETIFGVVEGYSMGKVFSAEVGILLVLNCYAALMTGDRHVHD